MELMRSLSTAAMRAPYEARYSCWTREEYHYNGRVVVQMVKLQAASFKLQAASSPADPKQQAASTKLQAASRKPQGPGSRRLEKVSGS